MAEELENLFGTPDAATPPPADAPAPAPEQPAPATEQQIEQPLEVPPEPQAEPEVKPDHVVPLAKFLDQRDELKALKAWKAEQEAKAQQQPPAKAPDPIDDPDGYGTYFEQKLEHRLRAERFQMSDRWARKEHGAETVEAATQWALDRAQKDPVFAAQYMGDPDPIDWIVRQHKRDGIVSQLPADISSLDELIEREVAKRMSGTAPQPAPVAGVTQPAPAPAAPRKSLVDMPSSGGIGTVPLGTLAAVEAVFPG